MTAKQLTGTKAPDGSNYVTLTDGSGNLGSSLTVSDLEIGAVEIKNDSDDTRAKVGAGTAANGLRTVTASDSPDVTALQIMDDWDETDRAKVNLIVGQAGVAGGAGASSALTQRVAIATDANAIVETASADSGGANFLNIVAGQATTTVKSGAGRLYAIVLNSAATATNTTTIYDNTAGSGTVIGRPAVTTATVPTTLVFGSTGISFATGLTIVTATANGGDMTVVYK